MRNRALLHPTNHADVSGARSNQGTAYIYRCMVGLVRHNALDNRSHLLLPHAACNACTSLREKQMPMDAKPLSSTEFIITAL